MLADRNEPKYFDYLEDEAKESIRQNEADRRERFQEMSIPNHYPVTLYVRVLRRDGSPQYLTFEIDEASLHAALKNGGAIVEAHAHNPVPVCATPF